MTSEGRIVDLALKAVAAGVDDFLELVDHCLTRYELGELAAAEGEDPAQLLFYLLEETGLVRITDDDKVIRMDLLLDGVVFTHRPTEEEIAGSQVTSVPDLAAIDLDIDVLEVPGGTVTLEFDFGDKPHLSKDGSLVGPTGWLDGLVPGQLVAFRRQGRRLIVEPVEEVADGGDEVSAIREAFEAETSSVEGIGVEPYLVLERVLIDHPGLFRLPVPPVSELMEAAGFEIDGAWAGRAGESWKPPGVARADLLMDRLRAEYRLNDCCEDALDVVIAALGTHVLGGDVDVRAVNRALGHGPVVEAFSEWVDEIFGLDSPSIGEFATNLAASGRAETAPALMLRARHHEAAGNVLEAEGDLERAVRLDPEYGPALAELAWYASDRGDAARTVSLLRRAGLGEDDPMLAFPARRGAEIPAVGRNEPCPCGSGRKYKVCHLGRVQSVPASGCSG